MKKLNITVIGAGFVGSSMSSVLSQHNNIKVLDIDNNKVKKINNGESPINEPQIEDYIKQNKKNISATNNFDEALNDTDLIIISVPTNFDNNLKCFDTDILEEVVSISVSKSPNAVIIIKSTVPIGFTEKQNSIHTKSKIIFSPEFLREGSAIEDNLYPSRIIVGGKSKYIEDMKNFACTLKRCSLNKETQILYMSSSEAESVKLFSNTYLAIRVAFFNELDSFALSKGINAHNIISGVCEDNRIGNYYNNPSFGYGGYCLPKDTKQLETDFHDIPQTLISAAITSNENRKFFLTSKIDELKPDTIGIYRLVMKENSNNFRSSAILDLIKKLKSLKYKIIIYEPFLKEDFFLGCEIINDLKFFKNQSSTIIANRDHDDLSDSKNKLFTRDLFNADF
tara:strand:+ start:683 stop:1870 length:1188 start_codon:yes stop_codon:yes gene_type:complete